MMPRRLKIALTIGLASLLCSVAFAWTAGPWATGGKNPVKTLTLVKTLKGGMDKKTGQAVECWAKGQVYEVPQGRVFAVATTACVVESKQPVKIQSMNDQFLVAPSSFCKVCLVADGMPVLCTDGSTYKGPRTPYRFDPGTKLELYLRPWTCWDNVKVSGFVTGYLMKP